MAIDRFLGMFMEEWRRLLVVHFIDGRGESEEFWSMESLTYGWGMHRSLYSSGGVGQLLNSGVGDRSDLESLVALRARRRVRHLGIRSDNKVVLAVRQAISSLQIRSSQVPSPQCLPLVPCILWSAKIGHSGSARVGTFRLLQSEIRILISQ